MVELGLPLTEFEVVAEWTFCIEHVHDVPNCALKPGVALPAPDLINAEHTHSTLGKRVRRGGSNILRPTIGAAVSGQGSQS